MDNQFAIQLFEQQQVRIVWDAEVEKYYFSIVDVVQILTDSADATAYWRKLKQRLKAEGNETVTMSRLELALNTLAEAATTEISRSRNPKTMAENQQVAKSGGQAAKAARIEVEKQIGHSVISPSKATDYLPANEIQEIEENYTNN